MRKFNIDPKFLFPCKEKVKIDSTLYEFEGIPVIFVSEYRSVVSIFYTYDIDGLYNSCLVAPVTDSDLEKFKNNEISVYELYTKNGNNFCAIEMNVVTSNVICFWDITMSEMIKILPSKGVMLHPLK